MAATNGLANGKAVAAPKITVYTNHKCPYAHRTHITLKELGLPFDEVLIDLDTPRPQWYLDINPRGLVPSIKYTVDGVYDEAIITESAIVSQFLAESFPSHLLPDPRQDPRAPLKRARINFFNDTWNSKVASHWFQTLLAQGADKDAKADAWFAAVEKEIEPLLADAAPFFGGSKDLTFVEVHTGPFVARWYSLAKYEDMVPKSLVEKLDGLPNFGRWSRAVREHESVDKCVDWEAGTDATRKKIEEVRAKQQKK